MATHFNILAWRIPWSEETVGLQSLGLQRVKHEWMTNTFILLIYDAIFFNVSHNDSSVPTFSKHCKLMSFYL